MRARRNHGSNTFRKFQVSNRQRFVPCGASESRDVSRCRGRGCDNRIFLQGKQFRRRSMSQVILVNILTTLMLISPPCKGGVLFSGRRNIAWPSCVDRNFISKNYSLYGAFHGKHNSLRRKRHAAVANVTETLPETVLSSCRGAVAFSADIPSKYFFMR